MSTAIVCITYYLLLVSNSLYYLLLVSNSLYYLLLDFNSFVLLLTYYLISIRL